MPKFPTTAEAKRLTSEGDRYLRAGNRNKAIQAYSDALKVEPRSCVYALVQRGSVLLENRLPDEAMRDYERAISLDPEYGPAYYGRAWAKGWKKDYKGELKDAQKGYQLDPGNSGLYLRRVGSAYSGLNRFNEAIGAYSKAIQINPGDEGTIYNRALCYIKMKQYDLALRDLNRALELDSDWDWALFQKGLVYENLGNLDEALANYEKAVMYSPHYEPAQEGQKRVKNKLRWKSATRAGANRGTQKGFGCTDIVFFILFCLIVSPGFLYLSVSEIYNENELDTRGGTATAILTNSRTKQANNHLDYEVQYKYSVDGGYTWYTCSDSTGRKNLWCQLTQAEWEASRAKGQTTVKYLVDRPWINRLVHHDPHSNIFDNLTGLCLFGISPWILFILLTYRKTT